MFKLKTWITDIALSQSRFHIAFAQMRNMNLKQLALQRNCMQKADNCSFSDVGWYIDLLTERGATLLFWETCSFSPFVVKFVFSFSLFLFLFFVSLFRKEFGTFLFFFPPSNVDRSIFQSELAMFFFIHLSPKIQVIVIRNCNKLSRLIRGYKNGVQFMIY